MNIRIHKFLTGEKYDFYKFGYSTTKILKQAYIGINKEI
jgi:hypothetical protein